jgi:hypothetical protein
LIYTKNVGLLHGSFSIAGIEHRGIIKDIRANNVEMGIAFPPSIMLASSSCLLASSPIARNIPRYGSDGFGLFPLASEIEKDAVGVAVSAGLNRLV